MGGKIANTASGDIKLGCKPAEEVWNWKCKLYTETTIADDPLPQVAIILICTDLDTCYERHVQLNFVRHFHMQEYRWITVGKCSVNIWCASHIQVWAQAWIVHQIKYPPRKSDYVLCVNRMLERIAFPNKMAPYIIFFTVSLWVNEPFTIRQPAPDQR